MNVDNSLQALFNPGEADNFFRIQGLADFRAEAAETYDRVNALWLSEFARLIYRQEQHEIPRIDQSFRTRASFLAEKGWQEDHFFNQSDGAAVCTQASILSNAKLKVAVLVFRGTLGLTDMATDILFGLDDWEGKGKVHFGFRNALRIVWQPIIQALMKVEFPLFFTGHSLGAALATLAASRCLHDRALGRPTALYTFGSPRVGNAEFTESLKGFSHWRIVDETDIVPELPPEVNVPIIDVASFRHTGTLHQLGEPGKRIKLLFEGIDVARKVGTELKRLKMIVDQGKLHLEAPRFLADHAPVNYTARLEAENCNQQFCRTL